MTEHFWKSFYEETFKDKPDLWGNPSQKRVRAQVSIFMDHCSLDKGSFLVDFGAGMGFHVELLKKEGIQALGVEYSNLIVKKANDTHKSQLVVRGDMRYFDPKRLCDAITFFDTSFGMFNDRENQQLLEHCHALLKKDGTIFIDYLNPAWWSRETEPHIFDPYLDDGSVLKRTYSYDKKSFRLTDRLEIYKDNKKVKQYPDQLLQLYPQDILEKMLISAGFKNISFLGTRNGHYSTNDASLNDDSTFAMVFAQKA